MLHFGFGSFRAGFDVTFARTRPYMTVNTRFERADFDSTLKNGEKLTEKCLTDKKFRRGLYYRLLGSRDGRITEKELYR